ncbi:MAG: adenine phosphoribosyltransferase [Salibacteraceae bacterium]
MLEKELDNHIRTIPDFPKQGIMFKDITPVLRNPKLCSRVTAALAESFRGESIDVVAGVESRGFLFGMLLAQELDCAFAIIRKKGKLPHKTVEMEYSLEYGSAIIEMHEDEIRPNQKVLIHDDLLATGGTAAAAAMLIKKAGGNVAGFNFMIELESLKGRKRLEHHSQNIVTLKKY